MRIGLLSQWFDPEPGAASLPGALARELARRGHDVHVLTGFPNYPQGRIYEGYTQQWRLDEFHHGVSIRRVPLIPSHSASVFGRLTNYTSFGVSAALSGASTMKHLDAVWVSNSPITVAAPMCRLIMQYHLPVMLHVLDLWPDNVLSSELIRSRRAARYMAGLIHRWNSWMYARSSRVAAISPGIVDILKHRGVPRSKLSYIPMWANEDTFSPGTSQTMRTHLQVPEDRVVVLYAGTLGRAQAIDAFIQACYRYPTDAPPIEVWIVGSGVEERRLREAAATIEARNVGITFLGRAPQCEIASVMSAADVHFVGLRDDENSRITIPSKVQATLASAKPMVVAVHGDAENVVMSAGAGFAADPSSADSMAAALARAAWSGRAVLREMGRRAREAYDRDFSLAAGADRVEQVLASMSGRDNDA